MEEVFKKAGISIRINVNGEHLANLGFAFCVALLNEKQNKFKKHLSSLSSEGMKAGLKYTRKDKIQGKLYRQKRYTNLSGQTWKVTKFEYLGQTTHLKDTTKEEICSRIKAAWSRFENRQGTTSRWTTPHITQKTNNGPVGLTNNVLYLPNRVF